MASQPFSCREHFPVILALTLQSFELSVCARIETMKEGKSNAESQRVE